MKIFFLSENRYSSLLGLFFLLLTTSIATAATRTSTATGGAWSATATWVGGIVPLAGDDVVIATTVGNSVTLGANTTITNVTINAGATLNIANRRLSVSGFFTNNGTVSGTSGQVNLATGNFSNSGSFTLSGTGQINVTAGNFNNTGSISVATGQINVVAGSFSSTNSLIFTAAGFLKLGGSFSYSGTFDLGTAQVHFIGATNQSIQGFTTTGLVSMLKTGGIATLTSDVTSGGLTLSGLGGTLDLVSGIHTFNGNWTRTNGNLNCGSSLLRIGLSASGTGGAGTFNAGTGTVEYYRGGNQTVAPVTYNNLTLSGSGVKTITTATTIVNRVLSMEGTATASAAPTYVNATATLQYNIAVARTIGAEWITPFAAAGGVVINGNQNTTINGAKVFNAGIPLTINSGAKLLTGANSLTLGGDFINNGGTFTSTGPVVIANTMTIQSIAGFTTTGLVSMTKTGGTATFGGNVNGAGFTINGTGGTLNLGSALVHTFTGAVALTSGTLNGGSSILNVNFTGTAWTGTGTNFNAGTGAVNFGGAAQTLATASIFNNLTFSGTALKTLTGLPTVNGILSMEGTATVSAAPIYGASATLQYNRTVAQLTGPEWITPFAAIGGVRITNTGMITVATTNKIFNSNVPLNIESGATLNNGGFSISGGSTLNVVNTGTLQLSGSSVFPSFAITTLAANSTVNYNGTAQTVAVQNYGILLLSGSGNKTFVGATTIAGGLGISGSAVAILFSGTSSTSASLTLNGVLQTALGSYGGTGSAATNQIALWFGSSTSGVINLLNTCIAGTWLGITNTDWNTATNWCGGNVPTALTNVTIGITSNQPVIGILGGFCNSITIATGATLTISGTNVLTVSGNWTNNGTFSSNTSTVSFNGTANQTIGGTSTTTFNNLTNANSVAILAAAPITIINTLDIANSVSILDMGTFALTDGGTFSNSGTGHIRTANTTSSPIPVAKIWNSVVTYSNPTGGQTIVAGTYNGTPSLELDNTSGTQIASGNIVTGGQLNINNGGAPVFDMNGFNLTTNALNVIAPNAVLDMRGGTLNYSSLLAMDGTIRFSGATNAKPFASGTVEYYGATQTVTSGSYFNLLFSGATGVYTMTTDIDVANKLNITNGAVTLKEGLTLSVGDAVTVVTPGTLTLENNASLLQTTYNGPNVGNVIVTRNTTPVLKFDATFWCSPTTGTQTLLDFSPGTTSDRYNTYDSINDVYVNEDAATTVFGKGIGYSIWCPSTTPTTGSGIVIPHQFVGVPNNGSFTIPLSTPPADIGLSLIGNPYPSALNAIDFINENLYDAVTNPTNILEGTLFFWSHNNRPTGNDFSGDDYYTYNLSGGVGFTSSGTGNNVAPDGFIASGQGFFVLNQIAGNLKFNNSMREPKNNANFYKTKNNKKTKDLEAHRIWLNIIDSAKKTGSQTMVGYIENATNDYDLGYDSVLFDDTKPLLIYSMLGTDTMAIQGRALPFSDADKLPIGYYSKIADNVTITLSSVDGLFLDNQDIFLEDKLLNVIHDLKSDPYVFSSAAGTFNDRFVLRFTDGTLGSEDFKAQANKVVVSTKNKQIKINSFAETIDRLAIYDLLGRQIYQKDKVNSNELSVNNLVPRHQALIVKTTLQNGKTVTDKIVY